MTHAVAPGAPLTAVEMRVLAWIADGKCAADIAREQYYSVDTVKAHLQRIYRKLGASNAAHAVHLAHRAGMLGAAADGAEGGAA